MVKKYLTGVESFDNLVDDLFTLKIRSVSGNFSFLPGQFLHLSLDDYNPGEAWPDSRCFSIQACPQPDVIHLTFSVKGRFTKRMAEELHTGKKIWVKLPYGNFLQEINKKTPCVFIAGGTGITPFISLFTHPGFADFESVMLFAGFKSDKHNLYHAYLEQAQVINPHFKINIQLESDMGILDISKIFHQVNHPSRYCISGPLNMILGFREFLVNAGVEPSDIITDEWE